MLLQAVLGPLYAAAVVSDLAPYVLPSFLAKPVVWSMHSYSVLIPVLELFCIASVWDEAGRRLQPPDLPQAAAPPAPAPHQPHPPPPPHVPAAPAASPTTGAPANTDFSSSVHFWMGVGRAAAAGVAVLPTAMAVIAQHTPATATAAPGGASSYRRPAPTPSTTLGQRSDLQRSVEALLIRGSQKARQHFESGDCAICLCEIDPSHLHRRVKAKKSWKFWKRWSSKRAKSAVKAASSAGRMGSSAQEASSSRQGSSLSGAADPMRAASTLHAASAAEAATPPAAAAAAEEPVMDSVVVRCGHVFHTECMADWCCRHGTPASVQRTRCPVCREPLFPSLPALL